MKRIKQMVHKTAGNCSLPVFAVTKFAVSTAQPTDRPDTGRSRPVFNRSAPAGPDRPVSGRKPAGRKPAGLDRSIYGRY